MPDKWSRLSPDACRLLAYIATTGRYYIGPYLASMRPAFMELEMRGYTRTHKPHGRTLITDSGTALANSEEFKKRLREVQ